MKLQLNYKKHDNSNWKQERVVYIQSMINRWKAGLPLVREKSGKLKVREKSGNFEKSQGNLEICKKSGKIDIGQGNFEVLEDILFTGMTWCGFVAQEYDVCIFYVIRCLAYFLNLIEIHVYTYIVMHIFHLFEMSRVGSQVVVSRWSWLMSRSPVFTNLKMSVESLKSQGKVREICRLPPVATLYRQS